MSKQFPKMVYKSGGKHKLQDGMYDYLIVKDEAELEQAKKDGWKATPAEAKEPKKTAPKKTEKSEPKSAKSDS